MTIKIPNQTKQWSQLNQGDLLGTLFSTKNIDLNTPGILKLAQRTRYLAQTTSGNLTIPLAFVYGNFQSTTTTFQYWVLSTGGLFTFDTALGNFAADALGSTPGTHSGSDMTTWNGGLYVTKLSRVARLILGVWTTDWSSAGFTNTSADFPHPIEPNVTNANLLVGDGNLLKRIIADGTIDTALTLPSNYRINWIRRGTNVNYIGLDSATGSRGAVAIWDGLDTTIEANSIIPINARTPLSSVLDDEGILHIFQSDARLMRFNGSGFNYEAELPPFRSYLARSDWGGTLTVAGRVLNRGMVMIRGKIHIALDGELVGTLTAIPNFSSGVWCYDKDSLAFYHKFSVSNANTVTDFGQSLGPTMVSALYPVGEGRLGDVSPSIGGVLIVGSNVEGATGNNLRTIVSVTTGENRGQFATNRLESQAITDDDTSLWCKFEGVKTATDKILFKYRTAHRDPLVLDATWTSTTVFTTTNVGMANVEVGDEITILNGNGAGATAHIVSSVLATGTYTVTVDEAITGIAASNTGKLMVLNWKKLIPTITYLDTEKQKKIILPVNNKTWFQIKGELRGEGGIVGIQELQIVNTNKLPAT